MNKQAATTSSTALRHGSLRMGSLLLMTASGFAGLGYQIVWTQQCALWLGHESAAVLAVVAAFFGGLALGALALGPRIENSNRPVRWYAGCELLIGVWSLLLTVLMPGVSGWLLSLTGTHASAIWQWSIAFIGTLLLLLPATLAMGATLPAMERVTAQLQNHLQSQLQTQFQTKSRSIASLYASNTLGAVLGVVAIAFWLAPQWGLTRTITLCATLNLLCAAASLLLLPKTSPVERTASKSSSTLLYLACTGLLGIGYEVLVVRVLSQVAEDTVYTFAMLLAVYLVGSALGAAAYARWFARHSNTQRPDDRLLLALAIACFLGSSTLWAADWLKQTLLTGFGAASMSKAIAAEAMLALVAFGLPTFMMGAVFSQLSACAQAAGLSFGKALGINTLGAALAPLLFGVLAFPLLGAKYSLLLITLGYLALLGRSWRKPMVWLNATAVLVMAWWAPALAFIDIPIGGKVISYQEGAMAAVSVVEDAAGVARLRINNRQQEGSSATVRVDGRQALLPILLHPAPKHALFLGLGTGITAYSAAQDPQLQVDAVELLPEVIAASQHFTQVFDKQIDARVQLINADARRYVRTSRQQYDVIVADNFHPARSGSGSLYTVEHFTAVRARLQPDGIFCQWLPLHQLDLATLRSIVQSFIAVYPNGVAMLASNSLETPVLGLVGRRDASRFDVDALNTRLNSDALATTLARSGIEDEFALLGSFIAGPQALQRFAGDAPINTDDHPVVTYGAPRITYAPDSLPRERLLELMHGLSIEPEDIINAYADHTWSQRLAAYWSARDRFIESGQNVVPTTDLKLMLAQVQGPLLSVLELSPDFRPAYDPLLLMARMLARTNPTDARALLSELATLQPARSEAALSLRELGQAQ
ncbi:MAG: fused MFS/spermidine synthase [Steroidobacteraceae bacterium]